MCGIAGFASLDSSESESRRVVEAMCSAISHRGPDGHGVTIHPEATLGMNRLAIVDVVHGLQPMLTEDEGIALVYNGEIYNAPALRESLQREGIKFRTRSDTEVILRLYERNPDEVESLLAGMWAFAIHDRRRRRLVLSRDRFGIKPLFIADTGNAIAFASELQCFQSFRAMAAFESAFALDGGSAHAMLCWGYVPETESIYRGIKRVAPAQRIVIDLASRTRQATQYWCLRGSSEAASVRSLDEACEVVEPALRRSVREHLESDVPIASFLSGGIDSSLVTAYACDVSDRPVAAYTIGFGQSRFNEAPFAVATAEKLGVALSVTYLDIGAARAALADSFIAHDEPFGDSSSLATYLLSKVVGATHKVALAGDGGDEVFAGYSKHRILPVRDALSTLPGAREFVSQMLGTLPSHSDRTRWWTDALRVAQRASRGLQGDEAEAYVRLTQFSTYAQAAMLVREPMSVDRFELPAMQRYRSTSGSSLRRTLASDLSGSLPNDMLTKVDRASMACHLEARVPFLDHRLVEIGLSLPNAFTLGTQGKAVLRELHQRRFGKSLAKRKKHGFGVPVEEWLRGPLARSCDLLFEKRRLDRDGLLSSYALSDGGWRTVLRSNPLLLWNAFSLAAWCEITQGGGPSSLASILRQ